MPIWSYVGRQPNMVDEKAISNIENFKLTNLPYWSPMYPNKMLPTGLKRKAPPNTAKLLIKFDPGPKKAFPISSAK